MPPSDLLLQSDPLFVGSLLNGFERTPCIHTGSHALYFLFYISLTCLISCACLFLLYSYVLALIVALVSRFEHTTV